MVPVCAFYAVTPSRDDPHHVMKHDPRSGDARVADHRDSPTRGGDRMIESSPEAPAPPAAPLQPAGSEPETRAEDRRRMAALRSGFTRVAPARGHGYLVGGAALIRSHQRSARCRQPVRLRKR